MCLHAIFDWIFGSIHPRRRALRWHPKLVGFIGNMHVLFWIYSSRIRQLSHATLLSSLNFQLRCGYNKMRLWTLNDVEPSRQDFRQLILQWYLKILTKFWEATVCRPTGRKGACLRRLGFCSGPLVSTCFNCDQNPKRQITKARPGGLRYTKCCESVP